MMRTFLHTDRGRWDDRSAAQPAFPCLHGRQGLVHRLARPIIFLICLAASPLPACANENIQVSGQGLCALIVAKLASVNASDCDGGSFFIGGYSHQGMPILLREYPPLAHRPPQARVLLVGGTHGDEYSSTSIVFRWMRILDERRLGLFHWLVVPLLNPDGLLRQKSQRTNARGVDLNRNMPAPDWHAKAHARWLERAGGNPRYYPGPDPSSEPETRLLMQAIASFRPQAIISVHAPLNLIDYDGTGTPPGGFGDLPLRRLGNFPGTLGHYAGRQIGIPVVTIELASSTRMPAKSEINAIWADLMHWLTNHVPGPPDPGFDGPMLAEDAADMEAVGGR